MVQLNPEGNPQKWLVTILSRAKFEKTKLKKKKFDLAARTIMTAQSCFGMGLDSLTRTCFSL